MTNLRRRSTMGTVRERRKTTPAKVLVIAFEGMEATLVERLARTGALPTFAALPERGSSFRLDSCLDTIPDAIWLELTTGRSAGAIGCHWHPRQVHAGEARQRAFDFGETDLKDFWHHASGVGRRVAVLDVPQAAPSPGLNGVHLREWGTHERWGQARTDPPELAAEILARHGPHPLAHDRGSPTSCDDHDCSNDDFARLRDALLVGAEQRARLFRDLLDREDWDLFTCVFTEAHCGGHQMWHLHDERSPWHDRAAPVEARTALERVYSELDTGLASLLEGAGRDTNVLVLLSHGMDLNRGGWQLLPELLVRLGYGSGHGAASTVRGRLPDPVKRVLRGVIRGRARTRLQTAAGSLPEPLESPRTRALAVMNGHCGAIRLNVRGRDPYGPVERGAEYDELCAEVTLELEKLESPLTGAPAVAEIVRTDALYGQGVHPNLPDLVVRWSREQPVIETLRSPRAGTVSRPLRVPPVPRSGEHSDESRVWALGPAFEPGREVDGARTVDLAPTVLALLGVAPPDHLDGRPLGLAATPV